MASIFINFQTGDGDGAACALDERLSSEFGRDEVLRSSRSIELGVDHRPALEEGVRHCRVLLVVIGPHWNVKALWEDDDWVRREIAEALRLRKRVIPVLFGKGTRLPDEDSLPDDVKGLVHQQNSTSTHRDLHVWLDFLPRHLVEVEPELGIGVVPGLHRLTTWWQERPESRILPAGFQLAGRDAAVRRIEDWLSGPAFALVIRGNSRYEAQTFVAAVVSTSHPPPRAVLVDSADGAKHALRLLPLLIVTPPGQIDVQTAVDKGHHVLVVADSHEAPRSGEIALPRTPRDEAREVLVAHGVDPAEADALAAAARRSVRALTRRLTVGAETPPWAGASATDLAVTLALVGEWAAGTEDTAEIDPDRRILERLTGRPYQKVERFALDHSKADDPLLHRTSTSYQLADVRDAWAFLGSRLGASGFGRWRNLVFEVMFGDGASGHLRRGVVQVLAAAGTAGDTRAERLVGEILRYAEEDRSGQRWSRLAKALPLIAEASPTAFLDAVGRGLSGESPALAFPIPGNSYGPPPRTHLLLALGRLCWSGEHISRAACAMARLAELDPEPDGNHRNSPLETLVDALVSVVPLATATPGHRRAAIMDVLRHNPRIGRQLLLRSLSGDSGAHTLVDRPEFRDWPAPFVTVPQEDREPAPEWLVDRALGELREWPAWWVDVVGSMAQFRDETRRRFTTALVDLQVEAVDPHVRMRLWWAVLDHLTQFPEPVLWEFAVRWEPVELPERHARWFNSEIVPVEVFDDFQGFLERVFLGRKAVVEELLSSWGVEGIVQLASEVNSPRDLGSLVAEVADPLLLEELFPLFAGYGHSAELASGWLTAAARTEPLRVGEVVSSGLTSWDPATQARVLLALPGSADVLELVKTADRAAQAVYWQRTTLVPEDHSRERYLGELVARDRAESVLHALYVAVRTRSWTPSAALFVSALRAVAQRPGPLPASLSHEVAVLLDHLGATSDDQDVVADLEIAYFSVLRRQRPPVSLYRRISTDPHQFVRRVRQAVEGTGGLSRPELWLALTECRSVPATAHWVDEALGLLATTGVASFGEQCIGSMLAGSPVGEDGTWPAEFVRDLLEELERPDVDEGFVRGARNDHVAGSRIAAGGGAEEREQAVEHEKWANRIEQRWPHTASLLRVCADGFVRSAMRFDEHAEDDHDA
ncbi:toll/interleukin-1 receptor domain-containing protein [Lentzea albida]|uniref:Transcriptional regulator, XRE family n=1 Tax=Lentzea albida TaxID=65499 RepID=A0A1H9UWM1_9PSEU|nr:toll/interleukin-1 receptor domain-containing protein [Lentzea albida]SES13433.1 transcriptional regulator, XRE family [Lentzea albida]